MKKEEVKVGETVRFRPKHKEGKSGHSAEVLELLGDPRYAQRVLIRFEDDTRFTVWPHEIEVN